MSNLVNPPAVIMLNPEINDDILNTVRRQLAIDEVIDGTEFDRRQTADGYYSTTVHAEGRRILVIRSFLDATNREKMDLVLFWANGLIIVKKSIFQDPPRASFPIDSAYLSQIIQYRP